MATFEVHCSILAGRCPYFRAAISNLTDDAKVIKTEIVDSSKEVVEMLLRYIYSAQTAEGNGGKDGHSLSSSMLMCFVVSRHVTTFFDCLGSARLDQLVGTVKKISGRRTQGRCN